MRYLFLLVLLCSVNFLSAQYTVESIPNQKLIDGSSVSNPDGILSDAAVTQINLTAQSIETRTTVQVAIVAVNSIGEDDVFDFAQRLFTHWKIGHKENDNGLLILMVKDEHAIRFHTGKGLEGILPDVTCTRIHRNFMVPEFKKENYDAGILAGMQEIDRIVSNTKDSSIFAKSPVPDFVDNFVSYGVFLTCFLVLWIPILGYQFIVKDDDKLFADPKRKKRTAYQEMFSKRSIWLLEFALIPPSIVAIFWFAPFPNPVLTCVILLYLYFMATIIRRVMRMHKVINRFVTAKSYDEVVDVLQKQHDQLLTAAIIYPVPFLIYFFYHLKQKKTYRDHPRVCKQCGGNLVMLDEKNEDAFLSKSQQLEEKLKAVNYDVWKCESCSMTEIVKNATPLSHFDICPKCNTRAQYLVRSRTIVEPTYESTGKSEETYKCKFCNTSSNSTSTIAKRTKQKETSSSAYYDNDRDSAYDNDSNSSSGGSYGGGSSGGGGSTSHW